MKEEWENILGKYSLIKEAFIECEETDPELKTNIQPLNEFRAALDHIMKMMYAFYIKEDEQIRREQFRKLNSHLDRAFFDICDLLSINYRNKIIDVIGLYDTDTIRTVLPEYYSEWKIQVEEISERIVKYRNRKNNINFQNYKEDIFALRDIYAEINRKRSVLEKVADENRQKNNEAIRLKYVAYISLLLAVISIILTVK